MFRLSRYYSIASLAGIAVVIILLSLFYRHLAMETLMAHQTRANNTLTKSFANTIWDKYADFITNASQYSLAELKARPELEELNADALKQMRDTPVVKLKIYNISGLTVFSTDPKQIGDSKSSNTGFLKAKNGSIASEITFRNEIYSFEQVQMDRNLISSYIPIRTQANAPVLAVFEVYSDVTPLVENMSATQVKITSGVFAALAVLYLFLFLIVRRADKILAEQEEKRRTTEKHIRHQAYNDSLTGLPNRNSFNERIDEAVSRSKRHNKQGALMFLDLDRFKLINESLGHDAGDQLLRITAKRIEHGIREADMAFRLSGDEFMVILEDLDQPEDAALAAQRVIGSMTAPISLNGHDVIVNISIGISTFPKPTANVQRLIKEADAAMNRAKDNGHNFFEFFTEEMTSRASERLSLETDLQKALTRNQFEVYYQPKISVETEEIIGMEALLRWAHPEKGMIPPTVFIPYLEDMGLINAVGAWVLDIACEQLARWLKAGAKPIRLSVNLSARQFRNPHLAGIVKSALVRSGLEAEYLELELTESMFIDNVEKAMQTMNELKALGVSLSIDDFGSGYSSLSYLKQYPIDYLKIDRNFIKDLNTNERDAAITTAITTLAHSLDMHIIAEGVENTEQLEFLRSRGCQEVQGFLFSTPIPAREFERKIFDDSNVISLDNGASLKKVK